MTNEEQDTEELIYFAKCAEVHEDIMRYFIRTGLLTRLADIRFLRVSDLDDYRAAYQLENEGAEEEYAPWNKRTDLLLITAIEWCASYRRINHRGPTIDDFSEGCFEVTPEESDPPVQFEFQRRESFGPERFNRNVTTRRSSVMTTASQVTNKRNVKVSIADYPKFSGKAKDWITFERKFRSVASSQGFDYVLQDDEYIALDRVDKGNYELDSAFIYDAFQNAWAESMNFYLVEQNKKTKNGRQVYLDAKNYFRGAAVKDAILTENMDELVNFKLTHTTPNGAEGFNNKFNDIVNSLEQQGHTLAPQMVLSDIE